MELSVFLAKSELDIEEYSFSQTTLEQVFLKFAHEDDVNDEWSVIIWQIRCNLNIIISSLLKKYLFVENYLFFKRYFIFCFPNWNYSIIKNMYYLFIYCYEQYGYIFPKIVNYFESSYCNFGYKL